MIRDLIRNNDLIEDRLRVVMVVSNPCNYIRRYVLAKQFIARMEAEEPAVDLFVVELVYGDQPFLMTSPQNPARHLQLRTNTSPLWHKENMINLGVRHLFPSDWKAFAWVDCDVEFESPTWATDTLRLLNRSIDVVQLFSHAVDMDRNEDAMTIFTGYGFQHCKHKDYMQKAPNTWHPGFAWACTRAAYEIMGGLPQFGILGGGDNVVASSLTGSVLNTLRFEATEDLRNHYFAFQSRAQGLRLGYVPGVIRHYFHGSKNNRKYMDRKKLLAKHSYCPSTMLTEDERGLLVPGKACPPGLLDDIMRYFGERKEDE
jgi:hypothetical protein